MRSRRIRIEGLKVLPLIAGFLGMTVAGAANALTIGFDDGGNGSYEQFVVDGTTDDTSGSSTTPDGKVGWDGTVGDWTISTADGWGDALTSSILKLQSLDISTASTDDQTLTVALWDEGLTDPHPFLGSASIIADALGGTVDVTISKYNTDLDINMSGDGLTGTQIASSSLSTITNSSDNPVAPLSNNDTNPYDLLIEATIIHDGTSETNFNAQINAVPLPAAAWLMGSALVLLAGIGRRASKRSGNSALST